MAEIRWHGHNCFRIKGREGTVMTDPVGRNTGYAMGKQSADIVTLSHEHPGHTNLNAVRPEYKVISGPGEYEITDVFVTGIRTYHDTSKGADLGYNTIYLFEIDGISFCHLGDLGHPLSTEQTEMLSQCDILFVPAGGPPTISADIAAEVVSELQPRIVIPMQFATSIGDQNRLGVADFAKSMGSPIPEAIDKYTIRRSDLAETTSLVILAPDSEAAKR